jgi:hypothetical protein
MKRIYMLLLGCICYFSASSQSLEELKSMRDEKSKIASEKQKEADAIKAELASLESKITVLSGWNKGVFGGVGFNLNNSNNWATNSIKKSAAAAFSGALNGFANRQADKFFWNNSGVLNLGYLKFDNKSIPNDNSKFQRNTDVLRLASLYGRKLNKWVALSALGEYSSSMFNFNDPGIADLGVGFTLTPVQNLVVVVHPINYHFAFSDNAGVESTSALGAKIRADYARKFKGGISWASTLTSFLPYQSAAVDQPGLFEYTWLNTIGFNLWKGIGVGFTLGLRKADFETWGNEKLEEKTGVTQSFNTLGLSYAF